MPALPNFVLPEGDILVASPDSLLRERFIQSFGSMSRPVQEAVGGADALCKLESRDCRLLLLDRQLPDLNTEEVVSIIRRRYPHVGIMLLEGKAEPRSGDDGGEGWEGMRSGAADGPIYSMCEAAIPPSLPASTHRAQPLPGMVGVAAPMLRLYHLVRLVAQRTTAVLITGPTGTGKELVARGIHRLSPRSARPFVAVNCAAIPENLLESELFGHVRGAFTGAVQSQIGRAHAAQGGTLFLDEVGELPLSLQPKLLRFLELKEVQRLGSPELIKVDVRVIAATNSDLARKVGEKQFREDLYYRLAAFSLAVPPLAERVGDILPLARHFLAALNESPHSDPPQLSSQAIRLLERHSWPGNVRELQLVLERACILAEGAEEIGAEHIQFPKVCRPLELVSRGDVSKGA
jgi:DNA-binding NtrC family response regulator